jgi:hypothetical protein
MIEKKTEKMLQSMIHSIAAAALLSLALGIALAPSAFAQAKPTPTAKSQQAPPAKDAAQPEPSSEGSGPSDDSAPNFAPVLYITSVEAMRSTHEPALDVIRVRGVTSSEGWESAELVPLTKGNPIDGILDLAFIAQAPMDPATPSKNPEIEAVFTMEPGHPFKGVRVYAATNRRLRPTTAVNVSANIICPRVKPPPRASAPIAWFVKSLCPRPSTSSKPAKASASSIPTRTA